MQTSTLFSDVVHHKSVQPLHIMTDADKLYQLVQNLSEHQIDEVLDFAEFLYQKTLVKRTSTAIPPGTITRLRGIAKCSETPSGDRSIEVEYVDYLIQKYQ